MVYTRVRSIIPSLKLGIISPYRLTNHDLSLTCKGLSRWAYSCIQSSSIFLSDVYNELTVGICCLHSNNPNGILLEYQWLRNLIKKLNV